MFLNNKYLAIYKALCLRGQQSREVVYENHHIIPKCMGGDDSISNISQLTPREHYIAHRLLTKITSGKIKSKLSLAVLLFNSSNKLRSNHLSSRVVDLARRESQHPLDEHHKNKISAALKRHSRSSEHKQHLKDAVTISNKTRDVSKWRHKLATQKGKTRPDHRDFMLSNPSNIDTTVYVFSHVSGDTFEGTRNQLARSYPDHNIVSSAFSHIISGKQKSHRGWSILNTNSVAE